MIGAPLVLYVNEWVWPVPIRLETQVTSDRAVVAKPWSKPTGVVPFPQQVAGLQMGLWLNPVALDIRKVG